MAKIFRKTHNPYVLCAVTHSLTLITTSDFFFHALTVEWFQNLVVDIATLIYRAEKHSVSECFVL